MEHAGQKLMEDEFQRLNRALLALSNCNQALLHASNEMELLGEICRIVVEIGGYKMAWVGYAEDDEEKSVRPVAQAGIEEGYLETVKLSWGDVEYGRGPTGSAIRTGQPCVVSDVLEDPNFLLWREEARKRGYTSIQSFPLKQGDRVFGALTIYSAMPEVFNAEETKLLTSLAENLAYGITMLQNRQAREVAEEELRQSEARYRSLFQNKHTVMLIVDPKDGQIVDANQAAVIYYGWEQVELCQMKISQISLLTEQESASEMEEARNEKRNYFLFRHRRADGSIRDVEVFSGTITMQNRSLLYSIINDITERTKIEEQRAKLEMQLQQSQKMEMVGRLAGGVAHDFNNMLTVILGHSEMALELFNPSDEVYADLEAIRQAATRSADLTRQLLAFARKQIVSPKVFELNTAVEELLPMLRRLLGEHITLVWIPDCKNSLINIDPSQIDQILVNLCVNARDAIKGNGRITLESGSHNRSDIASEAGNSDALLVDYVTLSVSDDGCGIEQNDLEHIFEPFFTTKESGKGTGLGLSMVYGIVKQNNGIVECQSEPGKGTTITIHLPLYRVQSKKDQDAQLEQLSYKGHQTILLVEDEVPILKLCKLMLERSGYKVLAVSKPEEALSTAENYNGTIELLLTDVIMPEMNGSELSKKLHASRPDLKTLFMSGFTADVIASNSLLKSGVNFIQKPFNTKSLSTAVYNILHV